jgi:hypothetical protein
MIRRRVWLFAIMAAACGHGAPSDPEPSDAFTYWLRSNAGVQNELTACASMPVALGKTWMARPRDRQVQFPMPTTFYSEQWNLPEDRVYFPVLGWQRGQQWLPGIHVLAMWDRWIRVLPHGEPRDALFQVFNRRGYQPLAAAPPWQLAAPAECILPLPNRPIRVLLFELHHPSYPSQWGLIAFWRGRPGDGDLSALAIGPEPAIQAEALHILREQVP